MVVRGRPPGAGSVNLAALAAQQPHLQASTLAAAEAAVVVTESEERTVVIPSKVGQAAAVAVNRRVTPQVQVVRPLTEAMAAPDRSIPWRRRLAYSRAAVAAVQKTAPPALVPMARQ